MAPARRDALLAQLALTALTALTAMTPRTRTEVPVLRAECEAIRARGYSTDDEEYITGLLAVAVPVFDDSGQVRAALALHAPSARMPLQSAVARLPALQKAAARMAALL